MLSSMTTRLSRADRAVGDVVDVSGEVVARRAFGYECTQFDILDRHLFAAHSAFEHVGYVFIRKVPVFDNRWMSWILFL